MNEHKQVQKVDVLSVLFDNVTMSEMKENITSFFKSQLLDNLFIVTANPEIVDYAQQDTTYRHLINSADYVVADGTGVVMASKLLQTPLKERVPGIELMETCLHIANEQHQKVFLLGAENEIVKAAYIRLSEKFPEVAFDFHHGFFDLSDEMVVQQIKSFNPDYIFIGMGYPRQELWIERHANQFEQTMFMGVGGSLEVFSGMKKRAPKLFRTLNLEWVYRVIIDWKRIGRTKAIPKFIFNVFKAKFKK
ncbi:WecB/TagA/CpsF family glycosyltransferase [Staphylococcus sp. ACRSN]|uniref:N-acetylglucosaminyldiphosphoundecaprenol N-acetyl-beta-D-mannosaminyltransferase TarA n=1 Tax=Staphylococcus sp. ACRSN TaxID=2918214 RepID=UPI001EF23DC1|nr:N-acetylglucosaminyldiphosphoundecaprenol N-acetyl-beta-D-mannosaminyltransferase TarA [Staphylococcus sp. ACRSN]MCG7339821.1 WecB/TagA/CpsF family glycosyltransferase [Staphylococcus sp. ACRSN]